MISIQIIISQLGGIAPRLTSYIIPLPASRVRPWLLQQYVADGVIEVADELGQIKAQAAAE